MIAFVNGIEIYYEICGEGTPMILLHGNGEDHEIFDRFTNDLERDHRVYMIDTRGHGRSGRTDSFHYSDMAEDVAAFIRELDIKKPLVYGFSDGGIVGLMLASKYTGILSGLISSGPNLSPKDLKRTSRLWMRLQYAFKKDPLLKLMLDEPNITAEDLGKIDVPVLITMGENDIIPFFRAEHIAEKIPNGRLVIAKGEDHTSYVIHSEKLFPLVSDFINELYE